MAALNRACRSRNLGLSFFLILKKLRLITLLLTFFFNFVYFIIKLLMIGTYLFPVLEFNCFYIFSNFIINLLQWELFYLLYKTYTSIRISKPFIQWYF